MHVSKTRWLLLEQALQNGHSENMTFRYQERLLVVRYHHGLTPAFYIHIDGIERIQPIVDDDPKLDPLARHVWRRHTRALWSPTERARIEKYAGSAKAARQQYANLDKATVRWWPGYLNAKAVISKLAKLPGITLVNIEEVPHVSHH